VTTLSGGVGLKLCISIQLLEQGESMDLVRGRLCHTSIKMTQVYAGRSSGKVAEALVRRRASVKELKRAGEGG
jgi:hypothetical protein